MMRIIAGKWRGRTLVSPSGGTTRPTAGRTREALFSMLTSRMGSFEDLRVVDLFAGTGALGLEALSRGAAYCTFVDHDPPALTALRRNIATVGAEADTMVMAMAVSGIGPARAPCDLLLFDPPYGSGGGAALLERMTRLGWATDSAWAAVETGADESVSAEGWVIDAERRYGKAKVSVLSRVQAAQSD
jgi:16S rRNA (guanine966-N2)-methyltransferase